MATKSNAKSKIKAVKKASSKKSTSKASKAKTTKQLLAKKSSAKKTVKAIKAASKKAPVKAVKKVTSKKAAVKASKKSAVKVAPRKVAVKKAAPKVVAKKAAPKLATKIAQKPVERKTLDRAPAPAQKAPMNVVARPQHRVPVVAPQPSNKKQSYAVGEYVVYPTHGVGKILGLESEKIGDFELKVFVIAFEKDKMTLRVPVGRAEAAGLRSISSNDQITRALSTLKGRAKIARGMWSRRAQEYEAKINSGNLVAIAEVVRDLHKNVDQSERSYSERMIYETAMHRLCGEVAASERVDIKDAQDRLLKVLRKQAAEAA